MSFMQNNLARTAAPRNKFCELNGLEPVTHSVGFYSRRLDMTVHLNVSKKSFLEVHRFGGIDSYLGQTPKDKLTAKTRRLKWEIYRSAH